MEKIFGPTLLIILSLVSTFGQEDGTTYESESIQCYSCTDQGDGDCLPEKATNVTCALDHNVCVETISAIKTSHENHVVLKKGCGYGDEAKFERTLSFHGITVFAQLRQCNSSLCNSNMNLKDYQLATDDNVTRTPNDEQCYSCIGTPEKKCSPSNAPVMQCYDTYSHCFDGNVTISIDNDTTHIPIKSCTNRYRCAVQTLTYGSTNLEIKGACCSGGNCNRDLSNETQLGELPFLIFLGDNKEEPSTTAAAHPWITTTGTVPTTKGTKLGEGEEYADTKSTQGSRSSNQPEDSHSNNKAHGLLYSPWLILILMTLF
ncbi:ly6/PLAUR domain-containing protein 3-like [Leptodactylus fuscus]|uniref:ly6/PLAUR domain-containing protein 3-like n=1 Tax=Leptodactylus fuscus TaxID=238119 RepID=UPI003F4EC394